MTACAGCGKPLPTTLPEPIRPDCCSSACRTAVHGPALPDDLDRLRARLDAS